MNMLPCIRASGVLCLCVLLLPLCPNSQSEDQLFRDRYGGSSILASQQVLSAEQEMLEKSAALEASVERLRSVAADETATAETRLVAIYALAKTRRISAYTFLADNIGLFIPNRDRSSPSDALQWPCFIALDDSGDWGAVPVCLTAMGRDKRLSDREALLFAKLLVSIFGSRSVAVSIVSDAASRQKGDRALTNFKMVLAAIGPID